MGLILGLLGGFSSILRAIPLKVWAVIGCVALVLIVGWRVQSWAAGKDRQIAAAHAETLVARRQTGNAILYGVGRQAQVFADASSISALRGSLNDQSARVRSLSTAGQQAAQEAQEGRRAAAATHAADEGRLAAMRRAVAAAGQDQCRRADAATTAALESLR